MLILCIFSCRATAKIALNSEIGKHCQKNFQQKDMVSTHKELMAISKDQGRPSPGECAIQIRVSSK